MTNFKTVNGKKVAFTEADVAFMEAEQAETLARAPVLAASNARQERNALLAATDYAALTDVTLSAEMTTYRQALRDVPEQEGFPHVINWPTISDGG
jgi:hypothetical protein